MIKYVNYDIVFQEFPDETTLAINLSLCPNHCLGCHSPQLVGNIGEQLTKERLFGILDIFRNDITCVALMGGDNDPSEVQRLLAAVKDEYPYGLNTGWYSGRQELPPEIDTSVFDYIKVGAYIKDLGPLNSKTTNQRMFKVKDGILNDITYRFWSRNI